MHQHSYRLNLTTSKSSGGNGGGGNVIIVLVHTHCKVVREGVTDTNHSQKNSELSPWRFQSQYKLDVFQAYIAWHSRWPFSFNGPDAASPSYRLRSEPMTFSVKKKPHITLLCRRSGRHKSFKVSESWAIQRCRLAGSVSRLERWEMVGKWHFQASVTFVTTFLKSPSPREVISRAKLAPWISQRKRTGESLQLGCKS